MSHMCPNISRDEDGEILLDWDDGSRRVITLSIRADGRISWAALVGDRRAHGTYKMGDVAPEELTECFRLFAQPES